MLKKVIILIKKCLVVLKNYFYKKIFLVTQVVLHELEHANQRKIMDKEESLEGDILRASLSKQDKDITIKAYASRFNRKTNRFNSRNSKKTMKK
ncbi:MAG: hypothetical protein L6V78_07295 [Clostridium sp.]|nr:MAG: hypothetical protein L6V78_07295 [Clostridium sp.]